MGLLLRLSVPGVGEHGEPLADETFGGQLQDQAIPSVPVEGRIGIAYQERKGHYDDGESYSLRYPSYRIEESFAPVPDELRISPRVAPAMIGMGLLEAIAKERLLELADPNDEDGDGISGKLNQVWNVEAQAMAPGRFGWKAEQPSVLQQSAGAFLGDMGITSRLFPDQNCPNAQAACESSKSGGDPEVSNDILGKVALYASVLAVPMRRNADAPETMRGRMLFSELGCNNCHMPSHTTGKASVSALSHQRIWPYTDLLLHNMGDDLSDERPVFDAAGNEWRTPPLWGVGLIETVNGHQFLLHDGRARGVAEAILWHGGEGAEAANAFKALPAADRAALVAFVNSL